MLKSSKGIYLYLTMVKPQLEYASDVWDLHHVGDIMQLKKVQRRAARLVLNDYGRFSSITSMLDQLPRLTLDYIHCTKFFMISYHLQYLHTTYQLHDQ